MPFENFIFLIFSSFLLFIAIVVSAIFVVRYKNRLNQKRINTLRKVTSSWDVPGFGINSEVKAFVFSDLFLHTLDLTEAKIVESIPLRDLEAMCLNPTRGGSVVLSFNLSGGAHSSELNLKNMLLFVSVFKLMRQLGKDIVFEKSHSSRVNHDHADKQ